MVLLGGITVMVGAVVYSVVSFINCFFSKDHDTIIKCAGGGWGEVNIIVDDYF